MRFLVTEKPPVVYTDAVVNAVNYLLEKHRIDLPEAMDMGVWAKSCTESQNIPGLGYVYQFPRNKYLIFRDSRQLQKVAWSLHVVAKKVVIRARWKDCLDGSADLWEPARVEVGELNEKVIACPFFQGCNAAVLYGFVSEFVELLEDELKRLKEMA